MNPHPAGHGYRSHSGNDGELSTLPSPSSSVVDLDSNAGTVETEVLLSSFKGSRPLVSGKQSNNTCIFYILHVSKLFFLYQDPIQVRHH